MAATPAQELFAEAACFACAGASTAEMLEMVLLSRTLKALDPTADTSASALISYGSCYACYGATTAQIIILALLDQISQAA